MSILQIVLLSVSGVLALASIIFMIMFIVEINVKPKEYDETEEIKSVFSIDNIDVVNKLENDDDHNVDAMLASIEEQTKDEVVEDLNTFENFETEDNSIVENEQADEVEEDSQTEISEEMIEDNSTESVEVAEVLEEKAEEVKEVVEDKKEEVKEEATEETSDDEDEEDDSDEVVDAGEDAEILETAGLKEEDIEVNLTGSIDYAGRLEKIVASRDKIDRDLAKIQKSILKYERTKRRKTRNQKMLDRRAGELTNLNLVMYSVTDIKNIDEDKKAKQEELTAHIAELKASIQDAEEYITSNKEKNDHNVKMAKFLLQEKTRYNEEILEIQEMIKKSEEA